MTTKKLLSGLIALSLFFVACSEQSARKVDPDDRDHTLEKEIEEEEKEIEGVAVKNSRTNPARLNEAFLIDKETIFEKVSYKIELLEIISGDEANLMVQEANQFNDKPEEDEEYILAKFWIKLLESEDDASYAVGHHNFDAVSQRGIVYDEFLSVSGLQPNLGVEIYPGAEHIGYTYFLVKKEDSSVVAHNRGTPAEVWFDLRVE